MYRQWTRLSYSVKVWLCKTYECIVNETHYTVYQTRGKGHGTRPQFETRPLLLNITKILLPLFEGGLKSEEASIQGNTVCIDVVEDVIPSVMILLTMLSIRGYHGVYMDD